MLKASHVRTPPPRGCVCHRARRVGGVGRAARAQVAVSPPLSPSPAPQAQPEVEAAVVLPEPVARPRLSLAVGMGATFDSAGFTSGTHAIPAFFGVGGFGDGLVGI